MFLFLLINNLVELTTLDISLSPVSDAFYGFVFLAELTVTLYFPVM
jgi:hypothetical protein